VTLDTNESLSGGLQSPHTVEHSCDVTGLDCTFSLQLKLWFCKCSSVSIPTLLSWLGDVGKQKERAVPAYAYRENGGRRSS